MSSILYFSFLLLIVLLVVFLMTIGPSDSYRYLPWKEFVAEKKGATSNIPIFTYTILFLCSLLLLVSFALNNWTFESVSINPSLGPSPETLIRLGAKDSTRIVNEYEIWRLFTPMLLRECEIMAWSFITFVY